MTNETVDWKIKTFKQEFHINVSRIVKVKSDKDFIYFDKLDDGTYRVCYSGDTIKSESRTN